MELAFAPCMDRGRIAITVEEVVNAATRGVA